MTKGQRIGVAMAAAVGVYLLIQIRQTNTELARINAVGDQVNPLLKKINDFFS